MQLQQKVRNTLRGLLQAYGTGRIKQRLWNGEFSSGRWSCLDETPDDCVYPFVKRYARGGGILDLGCGSGTTAIELAPDAYEHYTGVDISEIAIEKARARSETAGRAAKLTFIQSDIFSYVPDGRFDVILFRDSIYYIPRARIAGMLQRYAGCLTESGVFIVRMASGRARYLPIVRSIESQFDVVDRFAGDAPEAVVMVFRPRPPDQPRP